MAFADEIKKQSRKPVWVVKITLDQCTRQCGSVPSGCNASPVPPYCNYTYPTCLSLNDYDRGTIEHYFTFKEGWEWYNGGPSNIDVINLITGIKFEAQKIDIKKHITRQGKLSVTCVDMPSRHLANTNKPLRSNVDGGEGGYLQLLFERNPNYHNRPVAVYQGFANLPFHEFRKVWAGVLQDVEKTQGGYTITASDEVSLVNYKLPNAGSSTCVLQDPVNAEYYIKMYVLNALTELENPQPTAQNYQALTWLYGNYILFAKIDEEVISYSSTFSDAGGEYIYIVNRGLFNTQASSHQTLTQVKPVACLSYDPNASATAPTVYEPVARGLQVDEALMVLLCGFGRVDPLNIKTYNAKFTTDVSWGTGSSEINLGGDGGYYFARRGFIRIEDEILFYWRVPDDPNKLKFISAGVGSRGLFGTARSSGSGKRIYMLAPSFETMLWRPNLLYRRFLEKPKEIKKLLNEVLISAGMQLFVDKDGLINCKAIAPPRLEQEITVVTDSCSILEGQIRRIGTDREKRFTRWNIYHTPKENGFKAGNNADDYIKRLLFWDIEREGVNSYGFNKTGEPVYLPWVYRDPEGWFIGGLLFRTQNEAPVELQFRLDTKDSLHGLGDWLIVETTEVRNSLNEVITGRPYLIEQVLIEPGQDTIEVIVSSSFWENYRFRKVSPAGIGTYTGGSNGRFWICGNNNTFAYDGRPGYNFS